MIDQWNHDRTGWARFNGDMTMRYRLARCLDGTGRVVVNDLGIVECARSCVFLLLNPSSANAFKPDPTVTECRKRAAATGADVLEVVNLFAFRSTYPEDLPKRAAGYRGDDTFNDAEIMAACRGACWVIAGWGNDGVLGHRDLVVRSMLRTNGVELHHLGTTASGHPKHPLARGRHRIPADQPLIAWSTE